MVNTGQVMFSEEIYYYWPLHSVDKSLVNIVFLCIIYCVTNAVAVMYSRNIPMAEKRNCLFSKQKSENYFYYLFLTTINLLYIFEKIFWKICN